MRNKEIVDRVLELYPRIFHACHSRHIRDPKTRETISVHQARVLDHLDQSDPTSLMGLARHMGVSASTMSLTVDRLVRRGYVTRSREAADRRVVNLRLTGAGARLKDSQSVLDPKRVMAMILKVPPADRDAAVRGLALLAEAASKEMHARSSMTTRSRKQQTDKKPARRRKV